MAMATATWVAGDEEGDGDGSRSGGEGDDVDDDKDNNGDEDEDEYDDDDEEGTVRTSTVFFGRCLMGFFSRRGFSSYS
jgi:hypothetical protein